MRYFVTESRLEFIWSTTRLRAKQSSSKLIPPPGMNTSLLVRIAQVMIQRANGMSHSSIKEQVAALRAIFWYFRNKTSGWPKSHEWPISIFNLYSYLLLEGGAARKVDSSRQKWRAIRNVFKKLILSGVIPPTPLPSASLPKKSRVDPSENLTLGEKYVSCPPIRENDHPIAKSFLRDLSYIKDSSSYFNDIYIELKSASDEALDACTAYWGDMLRSHSLGRELIDSISREELLNAIHDPRWYIYPSNGKMHIADPRSPNGLAYFLGAVEYFFIETDLISNISFKSLSSIPFLKPVTSGHRLKARIISSLAASIQSSVSQAPDILCRALGLLTTRDCAAASGILIHEQPRFTVESVEHAASNDKNGKLLITLFDASNNLLSFTVEKPRAKARKGGILTKLASEVMFQIDNATHKLRRKAERDQPDVAKFLFLVATTKGYGHVGRIGTYFNSKSKPSVFDVQIIQLHNANFTRDTFTLSKVRNTEGILVWLRTGSVFAMAGAMGNSVATVLECYLPTWLYNRMLARIARRLQQKLIILATADSEWQQVSSDFETIEELRSFVVHILTTDKLGDPLSDLFSKRYAAPYGVSDTKLRALYISLTPEAVAALEVYVKYASGDRREFLMGDAEDSANNLSVNQLLGLFQLLYSAVHQEIVSESDEIVFDMISGGSRAQLKSIWQKSRALVTLYESKAKNIPK